MATICALSYANILMDHFERKLIYPLIERKLSTYFRFIDDIFLTWTGASNQLFQFFKDLNNKKAPYIKSDNKALKNPTTFLDTEIYLRNDNWHTNIDIKEIDRQRYLQAKFKDPKSLKDSLPDRRATQIKRTSSNQVDWNNCLSNLSILQRFKQKTPIYKIWLQSFEKSHYVSRHWKISR